MTMAMVMILLMAMTMMMPADEVIAFIKATQPKEFEKLEQQYGSATAEKLCQNLSNEIAPFNVR